MARPRNQTSPEVIENAARKAKALEMRQEGRTFQEIADELGWNSPQAAWEAVKSAIAEITREPAQELVTLELERLDKVFGMFFLQAQAGDSFALASMLRIMDRRARYLGLDAPTKVEGKTEHSGAIQAGGVLVVPGIMDEASWVEIAKKQQEALAEKETKVVQAPQQVKRIRRVMD